MFSKEKITQISLFALFWLCGGYFLGTIALLGPVRWLTTWGRNQGWTPAAEDWVVRIIILVLTLGVGILSVGATKLFQKTGNRWLRVAMILSGCLSGLLAFWLWLSPDVLVPHQYVSVFSNAKFTLGSYPNVEKLRQLKEQGYTTIVPLLHPTLVPFEAKLLDDVKRNAELWGLDVISAPMVPWVSSNENALETIKNLAVKGKGRYYVHCYLGRDRVYVVKTFLERLGEKAALELTGRKRSVETMYRLERGKIIRVSRDVIITPFPTEEEFFSHILRGNVRQVVCLLDLQDPDAVKFIEWERNALKKYEFPFIHMPISLKPLQPEKVLEVARAVKKLSGLTVVHAYYSDKKSPVIEAFLQAYRTDRPPTTPHIPK